MKTSKTTVFRLSLLLIFVLAVLIACGDGLGGWLVSPAQEVEIGVGVDEQIESEYIIVDDSDPVAEWARQLVNPLVTAADQHRDSSEFGGYKVKVIYDNELINAFAAPGGYTYISTGLIMAANTCAEPAGVMSHELSHVVHKHSVKSIEEAYAVQIATEWFLGDGISSSAIQTVYGFMMNTQWSQDHENEADTLGVEIAYSAGYNPYGLTDFFEVLNEMSGGVGVPQFLSSHPPTDERIANTEALIQKNHPDVVRGSYPTYDCIGTTLTLSEVQQRISSGNLSTH